MKSLLLLLLLAATAYADKPSVNETETVIRALLDAQRDDKHDPTAAKSPYTMIVAPFFYDGLSYYGDDEKLVKACKKKFGKTGTAKTVTPELLRCLDTSGWSEVIDADAFTAVDLKKLAKPFRKHKAKLTALAKDHALVMSHWVPAGPEEHWGIFVVKKDGGTIKLSGMLVHTESYGP